MPGLADGATVPMHVSYAAHTSVWDTAEYSRAHLYRRNLGCRFQQRGGSQAQLGLARAVSRIDPAPERDDV
jgi:hypothetical protein